MGGPLFGTSAERRETERRGGNGQLKEKVQLYTVVIALVSLVFTGGYNWRRVDELAKTVTDIDASTVKKDVQAEQFNVVRAQLEALKQQIGDLKIELQAQRR